MKIAVIGATGTAGAPTVAKLKAQGHEVVEVTRSTGVDIISGDGLAEALAGVDVAIDASSPFPSDDSAGLHEVVTQAAQNVVDACAAEQVGHLVVLSILGIHKPGLAEFPYYVAKCEQERIVADSDITTTLVKTTQWHEFAMNPAAVEAESDEVRVQNWLIQPIAVDAVAEVLVETALETPGATVKRVTGPEVTRLPELTTAYLERIGDSRPIRTIDAGVTALSDGSLLAPAETEVRGPNIESWRQTVESSN